MVEFVDGHLDDGAMRFVAHGDGVERRLAFFLQGPDALRQLSEASKRRRCDVGDRVRPALPALTGEPADVGQRPARDRD